MTPPEVVKQSELLHQLVLDRPTMEELGRVDVMWMYPAAHRVLGFVCKAGLLGAQKSAFKLAQISTLGASGILTQGQPEGTDADKVRKLETLLHCEVWSDAGNRVGKITDYAFNLKTGEIKHYLFTSSGWGGIAGDSYELPPAQILSIGRRRVLVAESAIASFAVHQAGLKQTFAKAKEVLREDYSQATEELRSLTKQAQEITEQAKGRFQNLTERLKERAQSLSQQAKEAVQIINEQLQEESQTIVEQAREQSQNLTAHMKARGQALGEQVEDGIQTLTVQAKEILDPAIDPPPSPPLTPDAATPLETPPSSPPATPDSASPTTSDEDDIWDSADPDWNAVEPTGTHTQPDDDDEPWI